MTNEGDKSKCLYCGNIEFNLVATMKHFGSGWNLRAICSKCDKPANFVAMADRLKD